MEEKEYKYDVAFSLLDSDHALAQQINDLLSDRYKTFLYSERQKEIAGADGELKFKQIFSTEARMVVVFYREGWGKTPWTRMEEEAIRGRAFEYGYDFVKFIPLDTPTQVPIYLPKSQLWINALRFGSKSAASVIEARLAEIGVLCKKETAIDRAARLARELEFEQAKKLYINTHQAIRDSDKSFVEISEYLKEQVEKIKTIQGMENFQFKTERKVCAIMGLPKSLRVAWNVMYSNTLSDSNLEISLWNGHPPYPGIGFYQEPRRTNLTKMNFGLCLGDIGMWIDSTGNTYGAKELAEYALHYYLNNGGK